MDEIHVKLILDRFQAQDNLIKETGTGIHRRLDIFQGEIKEVSARVSVLEAAPKPTNGWKNLTIGGVLVGILEAGKAAYSWFK